MKTNWAIQGLCIGVITLFSTNLIADETLPIVVQANHLSGSQIETILGGTPPSRGVTPVAHFALISDDGASPSTPTAHTRVSPSKAPSLLKVAKEGTRQSANLLWTNEENADVELASALQGDGCQSCGECGTGDCCAECGPCWTFFGEIVYLRPRDAEVAYAAPVDGPIAVPPATNPVQLGFIGVADPDYQPGFRLGAGMALDATSSVRGTFMRLESGTFDQISTAAPNVIRSLVSHPGSTSAATGFLQASAQNDVDFNLADVEFRSLWRCGPNHQVDYLIGGRYAGLQQDFYANFADTGVEQVLTNVGFDGGGIRLGLDGQRFGPCRRWHVYGLGAASFLGGQFRGTYFQGQSFDPTVVNTRWSSGRVVTILDVEAGIGWQSPSGNLRLSAGYLFSAWLNAVTTQDLIQAVQNNNFLDLDSTLSFDGLTGRVEFRY